MKISQAGRRPVIDSNTGYEYSHAHFAAQSPRVLLLHSVLGVGTNYFPCDASKIPRLEALLTTDEFVHVSAFPSLLRLVVSGALLPALASAETVSGLRFHRVIDNAPLELDGDALWTALNFQLVHLLDFLPIADWRVEIDRDMFLFNFAALHALLVAKGKLEATVNLDLAETRVAPYDRYDRDSKRLTLGDLIRDYVPTAVQVAIGKKEVARYSRAIGHSLDFSVAA